MIQTYKLRFDFNSYEIDKQVILSIENFIIEKARKIFEEENDLIKQYYNIEIIDNYGKTILKSITEYDLPTLDSNTKEISITFSNSAVNKHLVVNLTFSTTRESSYMSISVKDENARDLAVSIRENVNRFLSPKKTFHFLYHPSGTLKLVLYIFGLAITLVGMKLGDKTFTITLIYSFYFILYSEVLSKIKPFTSIDCSKQKTYDTIANYIITGLFTFLMYGLFMTEIKKWILGE